MNKYYYVETTVCDSEGEYDMPSVMKIDSKIDVVKNHADIEKEFITESLPVSLIGMNAKLMTQ